DVRKRDRLRLARIDDRDLLAQHDRLRGLLDRQRDADVELLEVAGILDRHLEREVGRRSDLVRCGARARGERLAVGKRLDGYERAAVLAADRSPGGGAVHALPD